MKLKGRMAEMGYSIQRLADETGIPYSTLQRRISQPNKFNVEEIEKICKVLHIVDTSDKVHIFLT